MPLFAWDWSLTAGALSSVLLGLFALLVGALGGFRGASRWFAIGGLGFGLAAGLSNVAEASSNAFTVVPEIGVHWWLLFGLKLAVVGCTIPWIYGGWRLLGCYGVNQFRRSWVLWAFLALVSADFLWIVPAYAAEWAPGARLLIVVFAAEYVVYGVPVAMMAAGTVLLAGAFRRDGRREQLILATAFCMFPLVWTMWNGVRYMMAGFPGEGSLVWASAMLLVVMGAWLHASAVTGRRACLGVVAVAGASGFVGLLMGVYSPAISPSAIARTAEVLLVAYAIMRHQYLGLDVKIRWTISKSTLAAIFVAVFFVVSEGAAAIFTNIGGSEYLGIAGAGLLLFAIAPLNRFADRFAARAVPIAANAGLQIYADLAARLGADGRLTIDDRRRLAALAESYGISALQAHEIEAGLAR